MNPHGYPSIDKPWLRYYDEEVLAAQIPEGTIWDTLCENNRSYPDDVALLYFGRKVTYRGLRQHVEEAGRSFFALGVRPRDSVTICMPAMPEAICSILALNRLGANAVLLKPTFSSVQMRNVLSDSGARLLMVASEVRGAIEGALDGTQISTVVECSAMNSLGPFVRLVKGARKDPRSLSWKAFLKRGEKVQVDLPAWLPGVSEVPAITVFSSGTTGVSKGIQLSNKSINAMILQYETAGFRMKRQDRYFAQIPIWFSTGIVVTMLVPLALGITVILEPLYDFDIFRAHIRRFEPDYLITATGLLEFLAAEQETARAYGCFKYLAVGGEYLALPAERRINAWIEKNRGSEGVHKGYGMCECGGAVTSTNSSVNDPGSSGIPLPHVIVAAFDTETDEELPYGERGELRVLTPCRMVGYLNNQEATDAYFHEDRAGRFWARTGDMGFVAENGSVYVDGRISDSYRNADGEVVYLFDIEHTVLGVPEVRQCKVIVHKANGSTIPVCHLSLMPGADQEAALRNVEARCSSMLPASHFPRYACVHGASLPVASSGKLDTARMEAGSEQLVELRMRQ